MVHFGCGCGTWFYTLNSLSLIKKLQIMDKNSDNVIYGGEPENPVPNVTIGKMLYDHLLSSKMDIEIMVDVFASENMTAQELLIKSCNLSEALRITGYTSNTVLAIVSENNLTYFIPLLASLYNDSVVTLVNPSYTSLELKHCLDISRPTLTFCSAKCCEKLLSLQKEVSYLQKVVVIDSYSDIEGAETLQNFVSRSLRQSRLSPFKFEPLNTDPGTTPAVILYSSGTTGLPKGVTLSHRNFVVTHSLRSKELFNKSNPQSTIGLSPLYHTMGLNRAFNAIFNNTRLVVMNRFVEDIFLKAIQDYRIEIIAIPPPLVVFLAKSPKVQNYDLSSLKFIACGGAPLAADVEETVTKRLCLTSATQGYGFTEVTYVVLMLRPGIRKLGSCGFVVPLTSCKVRDPESGQTLGPNKRGELCFKGPQTMLGYYNDEAATKEIMADDGWIRSGDIGYYDEEGYFYVVDRLKELIKHKGYQVAPAELEGILLNHPKIKDAGVVGIPDERDGELPAAFVVKYPEASITEKEVQDYVAGLVSPQKRLSGGVIFISEIPKNPTGKILRRELRSLLKSYKLKNKKSKL